MGCTWGSKNVWSNVSFLSTAYRSSECQAGLKDGAISSSIRDVYMWKLHQLKCIPPELIWPIFIVKNIKFLLMLVSSHHF